MSDVETGLRRMVLDCAYLRLNEIAHRVRDFLIRRPASGVYGVDEHRTAWDEYRYEVAEGPTSELESAWDLDIYQILHPFVGELAPADATLCSVAMSFLMDGDEAGLMEQPAVYEDAIVWGIREQLREIADHENLRNS